MRHFCVGFILLLAGVSLVHGQLDTGTITVQASRSTVLTPDQASLVVTVTASPDVSLDQIVTALPGSGITAANLFSMNSAVGTLQWSFGLSVPLPKMKATLASLAALQQSFAANSGGLSLDFGVQGTELSSNAIQSQACAAQDLVADAEAQARKLAAAAGVAVGPIVAISDGSSLATTTVATFAARIADPLTGNWINTTAYSFNPARACYLEVKFKLLP